MGFPYVPTDKIHLEYTVLQYTLNSYQFDGLI